MTRRECDHCALPVPPALRSATGPQFCCQGCRSVYELLRDHGLGSYYDLRRAAEETGPREPASPVQSSFEELDDSAFVESFCSDESGRRHATFHVEGLHCAACVWLLERLPRVVPGVCDVRVDFGRALARVSWDPEQVETSAVARGFHSLGYSVHPYRVTENDRAARRADRAFLVRLAVSGAVAGNVMLISFALYGGAFDGMARAHETLFRWASLLLTIPAVIVGGSVFFRGAWAGLRARTLHMDLPISIGVLAGFAGGAFNTLRGAGEVYFDSVTALIFLLLVGRFVQQRQQRRAAESADLLRALVPRRARRLDEQGRVQDVLIEALRAGDRIEILPGDPVPADGSIDRGETAIDRSLLTGESRPEEVGPGSKVEAGTVNLAARVEIVVSKIGSDTRLGQLMSQVESLSVRETGIVRLADRLAGGFVAFVLGLALLTFVGWAVIDPARAIDHTLALLVVSCPCALGLATPLAVAVAMGRAARAGTLVRSGDVFEQLRRPGVVWLDKTGTLTEGRPVVVDWIGDVQLRDWVGALERHSRHPLAQAFVTGGARPDLVAHDVRETPGGGIEGVVAGRRIVVGSPRFVDAPRELGDWAQRLTDLRRAGRIPILVAVDGQLAALAGLADRIRPDARRIVDDLRGRGWEVGILSGDDPAVVDRVGEALAVPPPLRRGAATPEDKLTVIEEASADGTTVMVGDGVNDAAALAAATVGIGVGGGAPACLAAADVHLTRPGLAPVADLFAGAAQTRHVITRNVVLSVTYNILAASAAVLGLIHPVVAAVLMPLSSLTVITSSFRTRAFEDEPPREDAQLMSREIELGWRPKGAA